MKIVFLNHNQIGEGTYLRCYHLGKELVKFGHRVVIFTTSKSGRFTQNKIVDNELEIIEFPDLFWGKLRNGICPWNTFLRILFLSNKNFDIVYAFDSRPVVIFPALFLKHKKSIPLLMDWADWWGRGGTINERSSKFYNKFIGLIETFFEEYFRKFADISTTISTRLRDRLLSIGYNKPILVLPHGCDNSYNINSRLSYKSHIPTIGYLGKIFTQDFDFLKRIIINLQKIIENFKVIMIGRNEINVSDNLNGLIEFTGSLSQEELHSCLSSVDVCVLPLIPNVANNGRWPSKINDYLSFGKPVVSTAISDISEYIYKYKFGLIAEYDPEDFALKIAQILKDDYLKQQLSNNALSVARGKLSWDYLSMRLLYFIKSELKIA